jgi:CheY-specific phosphatase CheX
MTRFASPIPESDTDTDIQAALLQAVKQSVISTFGMICGTEPSIGTEERGKTYPDCIGSMISFVGDMSWCLILELPRETATKLASTFAGFEIPYASDDMGDVIGELANVLAGSATAELEVVGLKAQMSLPTVMRSSDMKLMLPKELTAQTMPFISEQGNFWVVVVTAQAH